MLYHIVDIIDDNEFKKYISYVMELYWPDKKYKEENIIDMLPAWKKPPSEKEMIKETDEALKSITKKVCDEPLYPLIKDDKVKKKRIPFIDRFHKFFLIRQWNQPERDPQEKGKAFNLFRLFPEGQEGNYSKNYGNYNHFINVVAALARLIMYFKHPQNVKEVLDRNSISQEHNEKPDLSYSVIAYEQKPCMRTFKLMLAAFYHDIGKTIVDPRHGMEGAIILADHTTSSRYQLSEIARDYNNDYDLDRDDLLFISDLLFYHDQYGTLGTGEDGYLRLINIVDRIKRYSLKHSDTEKNQKEWSQRYLFDVWLLNIADIIVSLKDKYELQKKWWEKESAEEKIKEFFTLQASNLEHDLKISFRLLKTHNLKKHTDDTSKLEEEALEYSKRHAIERIRRLIIASLTIPLDKYETDSQKMTKLVDCIRKLSEENWNGCIVCSIRSISDFKEFCDRFSWIGKMDYALSFFQTIADTALCKVAQEINENWPRTGWIRDKDDASQIDFDYLCKTNAQFFADNYTATIIQILSYLIYREQSMDRVRNIEFSDARNRLTPEKIVKIISLEGPFRSRRSIQLILQTIYMY